ncbi:GDP-mannose 4,6-dehydratase [Hwangdonia seohaensis]|nr:GDP-mannose 4,6-dehydratase [Hwangdonia seohaensis]
MEERSKKKVFITGINGFTGLHLEKHLLEKGFEVFGTTFRKTDNPNHYPCDILKEERISDILVTIKPEYIIHLAAISFVASKDKQNIYNVNVFGTINLLEAINKLDYIPNKILIASSAAVYGNIEGELDETLCPQPVNHYGNSKLVMENMTKAYFNSQNIIITRPFNYTGVGQESHFLVPKIVSHFKEKKANISLGNIDVYREFNDVDYVIECYTKLLISNLKSDIINVCSGKAVNIKYIISAMENLANYKINVNVNPDFIRKNEIKTLTGSNKKLISVIGDFSNNYQIQNTLKKIYKH